MDEPLVRFEETDPSGARMTLVFREGADVVSFVQHYAANIEARKLLDRLGLQSSQPANVVRLSFSQLEDAYLKAKAARSAVPVPT